jgi:hypothetical protein
VYNELTFFDISYCKFLKPLSLYDACKITRNTGSYLFKIHFAEYSRLGADNSGFNFGTSLDNHAAVAGFDTYFYLVNQRRDIVSFCLAGLRLG